MKSKIKAKIYTINLSLRMIKIDDLTPTSDLLNIKINDLIINEYGISGQVKSIDIIDTDEFWLFTFLLESNELIEIRKIKNIC
jgi:hypothetical protein